MPLKLNKIFFEIASSVSFNPDYAFIRRDDSNSGVMEFEIGYTDKKITPWGWF